MPLLFFCRFLFFFFFTRTLLLRIFSVVFDISLKEFVSLWQRGEPSVLREESEREVKKTAASACFFFFPRVFQTWAVFPLDMERRR